MSSHTQATVPTTVESLFSYSTASSQQHQDLTPYSAVSLLSSFNVPARPDPNLFTPTSMTSSPRILGKEITTMDSDSHLKQLLTESLSRSPSYEMFDDDFGPRSSGPMKSKTSSGLHISMGPEMSPTFYQTPPEPFWGQFGVSAPPKLSHSPTSAHQSPLLPTAGERHRNLHSYPHPPPQNANSFRPTSQTPVLIAPNPQNLRPATGSYRDNSLSSNRSPSYPLHHSFSSRSDRSSPGRGKKGLKKTEPSYHDYYLLVSTPELRAEINEQELAILEFRYKDGLAWKEIEKAFHQKFNKKSAVAALQMRRRRLFERMAVRAHEIVATNADTIKWNANCKQLRKYLKKGMSKEGLHSQGKWETQSGYGSLYDMQPPRQRARTSSDLTIESFDHESWSDGRESTAHSLHDSDPGGLLSAISNATMDDVPSRAASEASLQLHLQQHEQQRQQQHQNLLYAQQQQHRWLPRQNS